MFMAAVDQTLLATATPAIAESLGGLRDTSWIAVGYLLASATIVPVYGRLGDLRGRRDVLLVALGVHGVWVNGVQVYDGHRYTTDHGPGDIVRSKSGSGTD